MILDQHSNHLIPTLNISSEDLQEISLRRKSSISLEGHVKINKNLLLLTADTGEFTRVNVTDITRITSTSVKGIDSTIIFFDFDIF